MRFPSQPNRSSSPSTQRSDRYHLIDEIARGGMGYPQMLRIHRRQTHSAPHVALSHRGTVHPDQLYVPKGIEPGNVNPRPVSSLVPSSGLVGAFSQDERWIVASAWSPYQDLIQGVTSCLHPEFRIGRLKAGEMKVIRGKLYVVAAEIVALVKRYEQDFLPPDIDQ